MKIYLLTHAREVPKKTNTGRLALEAFPDLCERIIWERPNPDPRLLQLVSEPAAGLLYPSSECAEDYVEPVGLERIETFVLLDATWQQARKMYNRSPYLQALAKVSIEDAPESGFTLRRNQRQGGLCTAECVIEVLRRKQRQPQANSLRASYEAFTGALFC